MSRITVLVVACAVSIPMLFGVPSAGADEVDDLNARADRIARELLDLQSQIGEIGEKFNQSQVRRTELAAQKVALEKRAEVSKLEMTMRRADAARYAMSAYVGLGQADVLSMALDGRQWDLSRRTGYSSIRIGNREQVVDDLRAAQQVSDDIVTALQEAKRAEEKIASDLERQQAEATRLITQQEKLQDSVQGDLAVAVARRQAAIAAAEQAAPTMTQNPTATGATPAVESPTSPGASSTPSVAGPGAVTPSAPGSAPVTTAPRTSGPVATVPVPQTTQPPVTAPPPPPIAPPPASGRGQTVANAAISQLGVRYSWGGGTASGPSMGFGPGAGIVGYDCSGLTLYALAKIGVYLPHSAQMQYDMSAKVGLSQLQPGDLVFYGTSSRTISHVAVYVGGGQVVHAPNSRSVVQYGAVNLWGGYYAWIGAGRLG